MQPLRSQSLLDLTDTESEEEGGGDGSSAAQGSEVAYSSLSVPPPVVVPSVGTTSSSSTISAISSSTLVPLPLQAQPTTSTITPAPVPVISTRSADPQPSSSGVSGEPPPKKIRVRPRQTYQDKVADICLATRCFPTDADSLHNTGIPSQYAVRRAGASGRGTSLYDCPYSHLCSTPPYVGDIPSCGSHVRKVHLGICLACQYCPEQFYYNGSGWRKHMRTEHPSVPWYSSQLQASSMTPPEVVKQEAADVLVTPVTEVSTTTSSSMTLTDIMAGPTPTGPLPLPEPISEEPPLPEESLPFVEDDVEDLTPEQEEALLQAGDAPTNDPSDDTEETEEDWAINAAWEEMRAARPEMPYEEMKDYLRHTFAPSDLCQFNFGVNREGIMGLATGKTVLLLRKQLLLWFRPASNHKISLLPWSLGKNLCKNVQLHKRSKYGQSHQRVLFGKPKSVKVLTTPRCDCLDGYNRGRSLESLHRC